MKQSLAAAFALAGAMALSLVSQALAGETSVTLGNGDTATVHGGGTKVEMDAGGNVKMYVNGTASVVVYTDSGIAVRPAANDAASAPKAGDTLADGTISAGDGLSTTPADAPGVYTWRDGRQYCEELVANGHEDWHLPSKAELDVLFNNRAAIGGFENGWYWSSTEDSSGFAWLQRFSDGGQGGYTKGGNDLVRCVRR